MDFVNEMDFVNGFCEWMFLSRMVTANWSWVQVFEQHGDYKLVLRVI